MTGTKAAAADYLAKGYHLTAWDKSSGKAPKGKGWQNKSITTARDQQNIGLIHGLSHTVCLDVDNLEDTRKALAFCSIDLDQLIREYPRYYGKSHTRPKIIMKLPVHAPDGLGVANLNYPKHLRNDGEGEAFSIRGDTKGSAAMDVLPPSIHPATQQPYQWYPGEEGLPPWDDLPEMPEDLLALWEHWDYYGKKLEVQMGFKPPQETTAAAPRPKLHHAYPNTGQSPIEWFNATYTLREILHRHGYTDTRDPKRMQHPNSSTKTPGVKLTPDGKIGYSHGSDPLADFDQGYDAYQAFLTLEHKGNTAAAQNEIRGARS